MSVTYPTWDEEKSRASKKETNGKYSAEGEFVYKDGTTVKGSVVLKSNPLKSTPKQAETKAETPIQEQPAKPVETPKQKAKKEAKKKAKNTASELSKQLAKLEQMEKELEEAVKNNPDYADTLHSVRTFKNYVQLVRDNYEEMGRPEKVVIDANAIWSINNKLTENLKSIFGNDNVLVLSDEEIEKNLTGNEQFSASEGNKNENLTFNVIDNQNNNENDRRTEEDIRQRVSLATGRIGQEASRTMAETADDVRRRLQNVERGKDQIRYDSRGLSERELILERLEAKAKENGIWIEDISEIANLNETLGSGSESSVYRSNDGVDAIKLNSFPTVYTADDIYSKLMDRIASHNELFKNCTYEILGFAKDKNGNVCIALKQQKIKIDHFASKEEIEAELTKRGFKRTKLADFKYGWTNGKYTLRDANTRNVAVDNNGIFYFFDLIPNKTYTKQQSSDILSSQLSETESIKQKQKRKPYV